MMLQLKVTIYSAILMWVLFTYYITSKIMANCVTPKQTVSSPFAPDVSSHMILLTFTI